MIAVLMVEGNRCVAADPGTAEALKASQPCLDPLRRRKMPVPIGSQSVEAASCNLSVEVGCRLVQSPSVVLFEFTPNGYFRDALPYAILAFTSSL